MKNKEIIKLSLQNFKDFKSNRSTIFYLGVALSFFATMIWIILSFTISYIDRINTADSVNVLYVSSGENSAYMSQFRASVEHEYYDQLLETYKPKQTRSATVFNTVSAIYSNSITGQIYCNDKYNNVSFIFPDKQQLFLPSEWDVIGGKHTAYIAGREIASDNEIVVTEAFASQLNLSKEEAIGITLNVHHDYDNQSIYNIDADANPNNLYQPLTVSGRVMIAKGLTIVGVLSNDLYNFYNYLFEDTQSNTVFANQNILSYDTKPILTQRSDSEHMNATYNDADIIRLSEQVVSEDKVFLWLGNTTPIFEHCFNDYNAIQMNGYSEMSNAIDGIRSYLIKRGHAEDDIERLTARNANQEFNIVRDISEIMHVILIGIGIAGVLIMAVTLFNLYNNIDYTLGERRGYNKMMSAIGMHRKDLAKLSICEMAIIFVSALIIAIVLSLFFAVLLNVIINEFVIYSDILKDVASAFALSWYPLAALSTVVVTGAVLGGIYFGLHGKASRKRSE